MARTKSTKVQSIRLGSPVPGGRPQFGVTFSPKATLPVRDFSGGKNDKYGPLLIKDNELADVQNMNYDQAGTLQKRKGTTKHYNADFGTGPVMGLYNYKKEDGTSRIIIACDGKVMADSPQFTSAYNTQATWQAANSGQAFIDSTTNVGSIQHGSPSIFAPGAYRTGQGKTSLDGNLASGILTANPTRPGNFQQKRQATWRSPTIDISSVSDKTTGTVTTQATIPAGTTLTTVTRYSTDGVTWGAWTALTGNAITGVGVNTQLQVEMRFTSLLGLKVRVDSLSVQFQAVSVPITLISGMQANARWRFATQNDILYGVDGVDTNKKWDGTTFGTMGGSPPSCQYILSQKNRMYLGGQPATNRSRLYFSNLGDPETWPVLNFIDVGKGDGDFMTGLSTVLDMIVITKQNSVWIMQGDSPSNFVLRRTAGQQGTVTGSSFAWHQDNGSLAMLSLDGVRFFDGVVNTLHSEKITTTVLGLNRGQFALAAGAFFQYKYYVAVPSAGQTANDTFLVYDTLRDAWTIYKGLNASEIIVWRQNGVDALIYGSSTKGQLYDMEQTAFSDDGVAIDAYFVTKAYDFGGLEDPKYPRQTFVEGKEPSGGTATAAVSFFKDLGAETSPQTLTFNRSVNARQALPAVVGVGPLRSLQVKVRNNVLNQGLQIFGLAIQFVSKGSRQTY